MSDSHGGNHGPEEPVIYQIRIRGRLDQQWTDWFDGMAITQAQNGDTLLTVRRKIRRPAGLDQLRGTGDPLVSVQLSRWPGGPTRLQRDGSTGCLKTRKGDFPWKQANAQPANRGGHDAKQ